VEQNGKNPRKLTPREAARLQGFPDSFMIPVSDNQAYQQFGNSVPVKVVEKVAEQILKHIKIATEKDNQFYKSFGAFSSEKLAIDIKSNRKFKNKKVKILQ